MKNHTRACCTVQADERDKTDKEKAFNPFHPFTSAR
jgi:hypothetical protein